MIMSYVHCLNCFSCRETHRDGHVPGQNFDWLVIMLETRLKFNEKIYRGTFSVSVRESFSGVHRREDPYQVGTSHCILGEKLSSITTVGVRADIVTGYLPNARLKRYHLSRLNGC